MTQGNVITLLVIEFGASKTWAEVATVTAPGQTVSAPGARVGDVVVGIEKPTEQDGLAVAGGRISAADTLTVKFVNPTAGGITPTANEAYKLTLARLEGKRTDAVA